MNAVMGCAPTFRKLRVLKYPLKHPEEYEVIEFLRVELWMNNRKELRK